MRSRSCLYDDGVAQETFQCVPWSETPRCAVWCDTKDSPMCVYLVHWGADDLEVLEMTVKMQVLTAGPPYIPHLVGLSTKLRLTGRRLSDGDNKVTKSERVMKKTGFCMPELGEIFKTCKILNENSPKTSLKTGLMGWGGGGGITAELLHILSDVHRCPHFDGWWWGWWMAIKNWTVIIALPAQMLTFSKKQEKTDSSKNKRRCPQVNFN